MSVIPQRPEADVVAPVSGPAPDDLRAEVDLWRQRALAAESAVADLTRRLAVRDGDDSFFDAVADERPSGARMAADGSDPKVVALVLWAVAIVAGMVALLGLVNSGPFSIFAWLMAAVAAGLVYAATRARTPRTVATVVKHTVIVEVGQETYRFDLRSESTLVEVIDTPGSPDWCVHFLRHGREPVTVDSSAADPEDFMRRIREYRPEL